MHLRPTLPAILLLQAISVLSISPAVLLNSLGSQDGAPIQFKENPNYSSYLAAHESATNLPPFGPPFPTATSGSWGGPPWATASASASASAAAAASSTGSSTALPATVSQKCPAAGLCYAVNIPHAGSTDLYMQLTGPSSMSWFALGQGSGMAGANIFVVYADQDMANVTLSPRLGVGHVMPLNDEAAQVVLLGGSGIANGVMTANVLCKNCQSWSGGSMSYTSTSAPFIYAYKAGTALSTNSASATIAQHDAHGTFSFDLAAATGGNNTNPFTAVSANAVSGTSSSTTNNGVTINAVGVRSNTQIAHGTAATIAFVLLFPGGAIIIRALHSRHTMWIHAGIQVFALCMAIGVLISGVKLARQLDFALSTAHTAFGIAIIVAMLFQPLTGTAHHLMYKRTGGASLFTPVHVWWGRLVVTLGIINGGVGLRLAMETGRVSAVYKVLAVVMWLAWMGTLFMAWRKRKTAITSKRLNDPLEDDMNVGLRMDERGWPAQRQ